MEEAQQQKQQRLAAWRQKQQKASQVWKSLSIDSKKQTRKRLPPVLVSASVFGEEEDDEVAIDAVVFPSKKDELVIEAVNVLPRKKRRWDTANVAQADREPLLQPNELAHLEDSLDQFMEQLQAVAAEEAAPPLGDHIIHFSGSVQQVQAASIDPQPLKASNTAAIYNPSDWLSDANPEESGGEDDEDKEEESRWALIRALKEEAPTNLAKESSMEAATTEETTTSKAEQLSFKEQHQVLLHDLAEAAQQVRAIEASGIVDIGREFFQPDDGIVEEAIREYEAAQQQPDSAIWMWNETHNKKKELASSNPSTASSTSKKEYPPFVKNIYRIPPAVAALAATAVTNRRAQLKIRVRGLQVPAPVLQFHEMGLPASVEQYMTEQQHITTPYPIQAQCIPCILAGRDVIGIAKTGSGKTLAYVLPMLRHVLVQQEASFETKDVGGPIALILVPARELAFQIHSVCKPYGKLLGLK